MYCSIGPIRHSRIEVSAGGGRKGTSPVERRSFCEPRIWFSRRSSSIRGKRQFRESGQCVATGFRTSSPQEIAVRVRDPIASVSRPRSLWGKCSIFHPKGTVGPSFSRQHASFHPRYVSIQQQVLGVGSQDDVSFEVGASSGVVQTTVLASAHVRAAHQVEAVSMDDGDTDTLFSEVEASSDTETEESDTESVQSIIQREGGDRTVALIMEEVPEARMTPGITEGLASLDTVCAICSRRGEW